MSTAHFQGKFNEGQNDLLHSNKNPDFGGKCCKICWFNSSLIFDQNAFQCIAFTVDTLQNMHTHTHALINIVQTTLNDKFI